jgi:hypothetical protein
MTTNELSEHNLVSLSQRLFISVGWARFLAPFIGRRPRKIKQKQ